MITRNDLFTLLNTAFTAKQPGFARELCQAWLELQPGDIPVQYNLAKAYYADRNPRAAFNILSKLVLIDPEDYQIQSLMYRVAQALGDQDAEMMAQASISILSGRPKAHLPWVTHTRNALELLQQGAYAQAHNEAQLGVIANRPSPLPSLMLLRSHWMADEHEMAFPIARGLAGTWPQTVAIQLCLASCLFNDGRDADGVNMLHQSTALDATQQVVKRYWGTDHPYQDIWPTDPDFTLPSPVPNSIALLLGANQITGTVKPPAPAPAGKQKFQRTTAARDVENEKPIDISADLRRRQPNTRKKEQPLELKAIHIILTSFKKLTAKYGDANTEKIRQGLVKLANTSSLHTERKVMLVAPDDATTLSKFGIPAVDADNAWQIKTLLHDLNSALAQGHEKVGSLLIVGNDEIIPFHRLPNPTDDLDKDVPSDNPYGTLDENYFVLDWSVGRLPCDHSNDPQPLLSLIDNTIAAYATPVDVEAGGWWAKILEIIAKLLGGEESGRDWYAAGITADIWKKASLDVFGPIGSPFDLISSPPLDLDGWPREEFTENDFLYFNLHGLEDSPAWYGQRKGLVGEGPMYPKAIQPSDLLNHMRKIPRAVLSEACYGAHILHKNKPADSMSLQFLASGTTTFVGSTKIAYGAISAPLISADLLAKLFWQRLTTGVAAGEALRSAKLAYAAMMNDNQGFLDGEDQKSLISFVLYGDPLLSYYKTPSSRAKALTQPVSLPKALPMCSDGKCILPEQLDRPDTVNYIKNQVTHYLPAMNNAQVKIIQPDLQIAQNGRVTANRSKGLPNQPNHTVYSFSRPIQYNGSNSEEYARVTVGNTNKIMKITISH